MGEISDNFNQTMDKSKYGIGLCACQYLYNCTVVCVTGTVVHVTVLLSMYLYCWLCNCTVGCITVLLSV